MTVRTCIDCGATVSRQSTGRCRSCARRVLNTDPEIKARRHAALVALAADEQVRAKRRASMAAYMQNMPEAERERRREWGKRLIATVLHTPEVRARTNSPEARRVAGAKRSATVLAWCPPEWRAKYKDLTSKGKRAGEAKRIVLDLIAGKPEPIKYRQQKMKLAWCPDQRLEEYRKLQKAVGAAEARRMIEEDMTPFERQLARVRAGAAVVPKFSARRADHDFTLGGIAPEAM